MKFSVNEYGGHVYDIKGQVMPEQFKELLLDPKISSAKASWEFPDGSGGRLTSYYGFDLVYKGSRFDLKVYSGNGNYAGGFNFLANVNEDTAWAAFVDWCAGSSYLSPLHMERFRRVYGREP